MMNPLMFVDLVAVMQLNVNLDLDIVLKQMHDDDDPDMMKQINENIYVDMAMKQINKDLDLCSCDNDVAE